MVLGAGGLVGFRCSIEPVGQATMDELVNVMKNDFHERAARPQANG
jgi:hypothetical protein